MSAAWPPPKPQPATTRPIALLIEGVEGASITMDGAQSPPLAGKTDAAGWAPFPKVIAVENIGVPNVTRLNLHIDHPAYQHYDAFLDLPIHRPPSPEEPSGANPANWDVRLGGTWGVAKPNQLPPLPGMTPLHVPSTVAWPVRRDGKVMRDADGHLFRWFGLTAFQLYLFWLDGRQNELNAAVDDWKRTCPGATVVRVLGMVNSFAHLWPQDYPDYYAQLGPFCAYLREQWGLGVEFVVFADAAFIMPDRGDRDRHARRVKDALSGTINVFWESANEPNKEDWNLPGGNKEAHEHAVMAAGHGFLCASGAGSEEAIAAGDVGPDYVTIHPPRDDQWYRKMKDVLDVTQQCLMLLNQKKNAEAIAECQEALKLNKKDGDSYYLIGLAMIPDLNDKIRKYTDSVNKLNDNRTADQITRDDLTAARDGAEQIVTKKKDEVVLTFAKAVVAGGGYAAQARTKLQEYAPAPAELAKALADAKADLG